MSTQLLCFLAKSLTLVIIFSFVVFTRATDAEPAAPLSTLAKLPVREVTVFKDGHAFVLHEGNMPVDSAGNVSMDYLPYPVLGTFWPYCTDKNAKLSCTIASQHKVLVPRTALTLPELLEANPNVEAQVGEISGSGLSASLINHEATILGMPERSSEELEATSLPNSPEKLPEKANLVLLKTKAGTAIVPIDHIQTLTVKGNLQKKIFVEEFRNLLTLKLNWGNRRPTKSAAVGMMYLQKGIRWIPSYKIALDGKGKAIVKLQATLINELTDLQDANANLVVGVPTFAFQNITDPMGLQQAIAQLSHYFQQDGQTASAFSNAIMSQVPAGRAGERLRADNAQPTFDLGPEITSSGKSEDLFVFTVKHVSLKKGQRMVLPVAEYSLKYKDIYALDMPPAVPAEVLHNFNRTQQIEIGRLANAPQVIHKVRLTNTSLHPLTTAPALIVLAEGDKNQVLAQNMLTYTPKGGTVDLNITSAVDVKVKTNQQETARIPNAVVWQKTEYGRVNLKESISLTNYSNRIMNLEINRQILGKIDTASHNGTTAALNVLQEDLHAGKEIYPYWWDWYAWPYWWYHFNGIGRVTWNYALEPHKTVDLNLTWHYYWR